MDILNKPINSFSFEDISFFCQQGHIEGIQLDYKQELPSKGLAKHFSAFSNTRGGVIIIGVKEDKKTGKPAAWNGVKNEGKLVDRIHQYASSLESIPSYDVHTTNEKNGNVFILIRIFEGDRTPYYVHNDANLWVRTGSISNSIDIASPDYAEILFGKREKAELSRNNNIRRAFQIYEAGLMRAEKERLRSITEEENEFERKKQQEIKEKGSSEVEFSPKTILSELGTNVSMLTLLAQPFYPRRALISPLNLLNSLDKIRVPASRGNNEFPSSNMDPIPDGLLRFYWGYYDGMIECEQIYSNGFVFHSIDVLRPDNQSRSNIYLSHIFSLLIIFLKALKNYYNQVNYQGGVIGNILLKEAADIIINKIRPTGWDVWGHKKSLLSEYRWDLELDTRILNDDLTLQEYFIEKIKEIYWSFGYKPEQDKLYKAYLKENGWLAE